MTSHIKYYTLNHNLDRGDIDIEFRSEQPPVCTIIKMEDELVWHYPEGTYTRGIGGTVIDRHFEGCDAFIVGIAQPEMNGLDGP